MADGSGMAGQVRVTPRWSAIVMSAEDDQLVEAIIETVTPEEATTDWESCPCCESDDLVRMIARHPRACFWVVFCGDCGKFLQERWNLLP